MVIPYIKQEFNPNIVQTLSRLSEVVTEEVEYVDKQTQKIYQQILIAKTDQQMALNLKKFNEQEKIIKSQLILLATKQLMGSTQGIEKIHIEDIIKLCNNNIGNKYLTPNKKIKILIKDKRINFIKLE